jgi:anion-transporting  ArsA/GET3 family ATPase
VIEKRLVIVSGKGGVGKSAVAAAIAIAAQRAGKRVLAISMVGTGGGLAGHLGESAIAFEPREIQPGLHALVVDRSKALIEYLKVQAGVPALATFGPIARAFDALASAAPAIREIVTMGKVLWEVRRDEWDLVVADGPPTGQIGSFIRAPKSITELVVAGRIQEQAAWMQDLLSDREASELVLVTVPEELPTSETTETIEWLEREQIVGRRTVVANRVLPELTVDAIPNGRAGDAARLHLSLATDQAEWLTRLPSDIQLPFLFGVRTAAEVASLLADEMEPR